MSFPNETYVNQILDPAARAEFQQLYSLFLGYLSAEHLDSGSHGNINAKSLNLVANTATGATGNLTADGNGAFDGTVTADADGDPVIIGDMGVGFGAGIDLRDAAASRWQIAALSGSPARALLFRDLLELGLGGTGYVFKFAQRATGSGLYHYNLLPGNNVGISLGEDNSSDRWDELHAHEVRASVGYYERLRTTPIGEWTSVAFNAANFTANGTMTWTVDSGDQTTFAYMLIGKTLFVDAYLDTTSVGGVLNSLLKVAIPGGFTAAKTMQGLALGFDNGVGTPTYNRVNAGGTVIEIGRSDGGNWSAAANNTYVRVHFSFEVQ